MTFENIKTITLTILVLLSVYLTWAIWTYQPKYDTMENTKTVPEVSISGQKEMKEIVKPDRIYFHHNDAHYGTVHLGEIDRIIKELSRWNFEQFEEVSDHVSNISNFLYENGHAQIVFPDRIPMEIYKNILSIQDKDAFTLSFDQIIIDMNNVTKEYGYVYFLSLEKHQVYRSRVTASFIMNFKEDFFEKSPVNRYFVPYTLESLTDDKKILVRSEPVTMHAYNYLLDLIPSTQFRDALFINPSFVQRNTTGYGEEYKNSSTLLSVNNDTNTILYVNTAQEKDITANSSTLLQRSIDFVNSHGGWTDNYYYVGIDEIEQTVLFRLYDSSGFPVFNNNGMSEILQIWGQTGIYQYLRNNFSLDRPVETTEVELMSGVGILDLLKSREEIEPEFLQEIVLGYEMTRSTGDPLIHLEPAWYYKYKDQWWNVKSGVEGGMEYGLE